MDQNLSQNINALREKVKNANLPTDLSEKIDSMISIVSTAGMSINNFENVASYINYVVSLPFNSLSQDTLDLNKAKEVLDKNHYGLQSVKDRILEYMASLILNIQKDQGSSMDAPILCLVGLVGTGKTTLAYSIAQALGRSFERIPFGGLGDIRSIRGQARGLNDAEPGLIIKKLINAKTKNPVILLDEIDRVVEVSRADVMGVLLEVLDPTQNKAFVDHYVDYPFDLSQVLFVATANNTTNISTAVLDRLEVIQMPSYSDEEKLNIGKSYLLPKIIERSGLGVGQLVFDETIWPSIIRPLGFDSGIRSLERAIEGISRKAARMIVEGKIKKDAIIRIDSSNIKAFMT